MAPARTIEVELLEDDARVIIQAAGDSHGQSADRLATVLREGLDQYVRDEAEWRLLTADGQDAPQGAHMQELKRRETEALTASMRARTIASEMRFEALRARVRQLEQQNDEFRERMSRLREVAQRLKRRRVQLTALLNPPPGASEPPKPGARLTDRLGRFFRSHKGSR